ncbi:hypothetical protein CDIK_3347 [Cucumispora dikerogammari]|nr:hypothetical protein CDIK_3347 [Cucumispora dikerogammari]
MRTRNKILRILIIIALSILILYCISVSTYFIISKDNAEGLTTALDETIRNTRVNVTLPMDPTSEHPAALPDTDTTVLQENFVSASSVLTETTEILDLANFQNNQIISKSSTKLTTPTIPQSIESTCFKTEQNRCLTQRQQKSIDENSRGPGYNKFDEYEIKIVPLVEKNRIPLNEEEDCADVAKEACKNDSAI